MNLIDVMKYPARRWAWELMKKCGFNMWNRGIGFISACVQYIHDDPYRTMEDAYKLVAQEVGSDPKAVGRSIYYNMLQANEDALNALIRSIGHEGPATVAKIMSSMVMKYGEDAAAKE